MSAYLGLDPLYSTFSTQRISTNGATSYALNFNPGSSSALLVIYNGSILRADIDYTVQAQRIVPTGTPWPSATANNLFIIYLGLKASVPMPVANSIGFNEIQSNVINSFVQNAVIDTGTANAMSVTNTRPWTSYVDGKGIVITKSGTENTSGTVTLAIDGLAAVPVLDSLGNALYPYALRAGQTFILTYSAASSGFRMLTLGASSDAALLGYFPLSAAPAGWIAADGSAISRTTYALLFSKIGTLFGAGNGTTTFNLPDLRGEFVRGWDNGRGVDSGRTLGSAQAATGVGVYFNGGATPTLRYVNTDGVDTEGAITTGSYAGNNPGATNSWVRVRPRNVSFLACLKYV